MSANSINSGEAYLLNQLRHAMDSNRDGKISDRELIDFLDGKRDGKLTSGDLAALEDRFAAAMGGSPNSPAAASTAYRGNDDGANVGDTKGFGYRGIPDGKVAADNQHGFLHVTKDRRNSPSGDQRGLNAAFVDGLKTSFEPDASGVIDGKAAPGLEGWKALVDRGENGKYRGYKGYLDANYSGGYAQWKQDFEQLRRNVLLGENNPVNITNTSGIG